MTVYWLCCRQLLTVIRDPTVQALRTAQKIVSSFQKNLVQSTNTFTTHRQSQ